MATRPILDNDGGSGTNARRRTASRNNQALWSAAASAVRGGYPGSTWAAFTNVKRDVSNASKNAALSRAASNAPRPSSGGSSRSSGRSVSYSRSRGGGGGGGGGGMGGGGGSANAQKQLDMLKALLTSSAYKPQENAELKGRVNTAVDTDLGYGNTTYDQLDQRLGQVGPNAFQGLEARRTAAAADPGIMSLLEQQGGNVGDYRAAMSQMDAQGAGMADNWRNLVAVLAGNETSGRQSRVAESAQARAAMQNSLGAQRSALLAQVEAQDRAVNEQRRQAALQVIAEMAGLVGQHGLKAPTMAELGYA